MYFFYIDESGSRDPATSGRYPDGSSFIKDPIYVLFATCLHESRWGALDQELTDAKLRLRTKLHQQKHIALPTLADCEVKSTSLRVPKQPGDKGYSPFVHNLDAADKTLLSQLFFSQIAKHHMRAFAIVIDKRELQAHMSAELMHKKAYELLLERIEHFLAEYHSNQRGLVVMDDTQKQLNHAVAMKHAFFQREGNANLRFRHLVEYPFFTDSKLSHGVQLADLCAYNVYRAFQRPDFAYPYFQQLLPAFYRSDRTPIDKLDGLKIWPETSPLVASAGLVYHSFIEANKKPAAESSGPGK